MTDAPERPPSGIRMAVAASGIAGLALAVALVLYSGLPEILRLMAAAGWGLLWLVPIHLLPVGVDAVGWRALLRDQRPARLPLLIWVAAIRDSVNTLLPVARVGGEVVGVRLVMLRGVPGARAGASIIVEITTTLVTQFLFALLGLAILVYDLRDSAVAKLVLVGLLVSVPVMVVFFLVQHRWGLFQLIERVLAAVAGRGVLTMVGDPARLDQAVQELYRRRRDVLVCGVWQLAGMFASTFELWFTLYLLGHAPTILAAIMIESLTQAVQSASFLVPAGLGTQEGSFLLFGAATGLAPEVGLALSLARRVRQLGFGLPAILSWQWVEGRRLGRALGRRAEHAD